MKEPQILKAEVRLGREVATVVKHLHPDDVSEVVGGEVKRLLRGLEAHALQALDKDERISLEIYIEKEPV